jgi:hypothetical protein
MCGMVVIACSEGGGPNPPPPLECEAGSTRTLAIWGHEILDPNVVGACIRLPAAGGAGAEHLYIPLATEGQETPDGVSAPYQVTGSSPVTATPPVLSSPAL